MKLIKKIKNFLVDFYYKITFWFKGILDYFNYNYALNLEDINCSVIENNGYDVIKIELLNGCYYGRYFGCLDKIIIWCCKTVFYPHIYKKRVNIAYCMKDGDGYDKILTITEQAKPIYSFKEFEQLVRSSVFNWGEKYMDERKVITHVYIHCYVLYKPSKEESTSNIFNIQKRFYSDNSDFISPIKRDNNKKSFMSADSETIIYEGSHLIVILTGYFTYKFRGKQKEEIISYKISNISKKESNLLIINFINKLFYICIKYNIKIIYFHNLTFDGILILNGLLDYKPKGIGIKPLIIDKEIYQIKISFDKLEIILIDSLKMLPASLKKLAKAFIPELEGKLDFDSKLVNENNYYT